eukprot:g22666.t1
MPIVYCGPCSSTVEFKCILLTTFVGKKYSLGAFYYCGHSIAKRSDLGFAVAVLEVFVVVHTQGRLQNGWLENATLELATADYTLEQGNSSQDMLPDLKEDAARFLRKLL